MKDWKLKSWQNLSMVTEGRGFGGGERLGEGRRMASGEKLCSMTLVGVTGVCSLHKHALRYKLRTYALFWVYAILLGKTGLRSHPILETDARATGVEEEGEVLSSQPLAPPYGGQRPSEGPIEQGLRTWTRSPGCL